MNVDQWEITYIFLGLPALRLGSGRTSRRDSGTAEMAASARRESVAGSAVASEAGRDWRTSVTLAAGLSPSEPPHTSQKLASASFSKSQCAQRMRALLRALFLTLIRESTLPRVRLEKHFAQYL